MVPDTRMRVGIIGLGMLGSAVAVHLLDVGFDVTAYNRTGAKAAAVGAAGARVVASPMDVARGSDIVITVVRDAGAVRDVSFGSRGIAEGVHEGLVVADMSTIDPAESADMAARFRKYGIEKIDIPVMGGPNVAVSGDLVMMASGNAEAFRRCRGVLDGIASRVFFLGESGVAHSVKLAMNLQITMLALALAEGITFVRKSGVDPKKFLEVLNSTYFKTGMSEKKAYRMIDGLQDATFTLANLKKDISTMTHAAKSMGMNLPMIARAEEVYGDAVRSGLGEMDYTGIIRHIEKPDGADLQE